MRYRFSIWRLYGLAGKWIGMTALVAMAGLLLLGGFRLWLLAGGLAGLALALAVLLLGIPLGVYAGPVIVTSHGLRLCLLDIPPFRVSWDEITSAQTLWLLGDPYLALHTRKRPVIVPWVFTDPEGLRQAILRHSPANHPLREILERHFTA